MQQLQWSHELQALTDITVGFLIGTRDVGNGLKKKKAGEHISQLKREGEGLTDLPG